jgi:uncharacterized MAPEG superfamily protein
VRAEEAKWRVTLEHTEQLHTAALAAAQEQHTAAVAALKQIHLEELDAAKRRLADARLLEGLAHQVLLCRYCYQFCYFADWSPIVELLLLHNLTTAILLVTAGTTSSVTATSVTTLSVC